jgi:hypothetical protein
MFARRSLVSSDRVVAGLSDLAGIRAAAKAVSPKLAKQVAQANGLYLWRRCWKPGPGHPADAVTQREKYFLDWF